MGDDQGRGDVEVDVEGRGRGGVEVRCRGGVEVRCRCQCGGGAEAKQGT
jgi:hypothetical protein